MAAELTERYQDLLDGSYDCVDRMVLNAYDTLCYSGGGFRHWWRRLMGGSDEQLDNAHLMRMAGRFSRRVRGFAKAHRIPLIDCRSGEHKHEIAEDYLAEHSVGRGLFMILVARAVAPVWDVQRSSGGGIHLTKKLSEARTVGRLVQVCEQWIYSACLCFALGIEEQEQTGFRYAYSVFQVEYSRNLLFHRGSQLEQVFQRLVDRTRARLDIRQVRTLFGAKRRSHWHWKRHAPPRLGVLIGLGV